VALDPELPEAHATLAGVLEWQYRRSEALAEFERALELNPNLADARYGLIFYQNGRPDDAIAFILRAKRLDPFHPAVYARLLGTAHYLAGHEGEALELLRIAVVREPNYRAAQVWLAAAAAQAGQMDEARQAAAAVLRIDPDFTIAKWLDFIRLARPQDAAHLADGLRRAGLPD
jgi:adenylate cyclase